MSKLQTSAFAGKGSQRPCSDPDYVRLDGYQGGYISLDAHVGPETAVKVRKHEHTPDVPSAFATVQLTEGVQDVTLFFDPEDLDVAIAMRDALNAAIRHLRKHA